MCNYRQCPIHPGHGLSERLAEAGGLLPLLPADLQRVRAGGEECGGGEAQTVGKTDSRLHSADVLSGL